MIPLLLTVGLFFAWPRLHHHALGAAATKPEPPKNGEMTPTASILVKASPVPGYVTSWLGNTFGGSGSPNCGSNWSVTGASCSHIYDYGAKNAPGAIYDIAVTPNGTVFTTQYYDEGHMTLAMFRNGQIVGWPRCNKNGDPNGGGWAATSNGTYVFIAFEIKGTTGISRFNNDGTAANFPQGRDYGAIAGEGSQGCSNAVKVETGRPGAPDRANAIWGMAASSTELYVSDSVTNTVKVYSISTMALVRSFGLSGGASPGRILYNSNDATLWVAQRNTSEPGNLAAGGASFPINHYSTTGTLLSGSISDVVVPMAMAMNGTTMLIADAGADMQIKEYNSSGVRIGQLGVQGGMLSGTNPHGSYAANALAYPSGLGVDSSGNIYVSEQYFPTNYYASYANADWVSIMYGSDLRSFNPSFSLNWKTIALSVFQEPAAADPATDGTEVYDAIAGFNMNYANNTPGGEQNWDATTLDLVHYPDDPVTIKGIFFGPSRITNVGGYKYMFLDAGTSGPPANGGLVKRQIGKIWVPMTFFITKYIPYWANGSNGIGNVQASCNYGGKGCIWNDANGDGEPAASEIVNVSSGAGFDYYTADLDMDANADVWIANLSSGVWRYTHSSQGAGGLMSYPQANAIHYGTPTIFSKVMRANYDAVNDRLYVAGWSNSSPDPGNENYATNTAGNTLARYDNFEAHGGGFPVATWVTNLPYGMLRDNDSWNVSCSAPPCATQMVRNIRIAGNYIFVDNADPIYTHPGAYTGLTLVDAAVFYIRAYKVADGTFAGNVWPGSQVNYFSTNWNDIQSSFTTFQRSTGEYLIFNQNETNSSINLYRGLLQNFSQY